MYRLLLLLILSLLNSFANAQTTWPEFNKNYFSGSATGYSGALSIARLDSGYLVAGWRRDALNQPEALMIRKLDAQGNSILDKSYYWPGAKVSPRQPSKMIRLANGNFIVLGIIQHLPVVYTFPMLWCFTPQGDTLWTKSYPDTLDRSFLSGLLMPDGGLLLAGRKEAGPLPGGTDSWLVKTDSLGNIQWERTYDFGYKSFAEFISVCPNGGYIIAGETSPMYNGTSDGYVLKIDSSGTQEWIQTFGNPNVSDCFGDVLPLADGSFLYTGSPATAISLSGTIPKAKATLIKLDSAGNTIWHKTYGPQRNYMEIFRPTLLADGSFVMLGQAAYVQPGVQRGEGIMFKVDAQGDSIWYRNYMMVTGPQSDNYLRDIAPTPDGGFAVAGFYTPEAPDTGTQDMWVFKVDSMGCLDATCYILAADETIMIEVTMDLQIYPNPAISQVVISAHDLQSVTLLDGLGRVVSTTSTTFEHLTLSLSGLASGLYCVQAQTRAGIQSKRLIVSEL